MKLQVFKKYCEFQALTEKQIEAREVTGIVLFAEKMDLQDEIYSGDVVKQSMNGFMEFYQHLGEMHKKLAPAFLVENWQLSNGDWHITTKVKNDDLWDKVKSGFYTGFSIGGRAGGVWLDPERTEKRLTRIITEEISFVDKAANGGMYSIVKRLEEGGDFIMADIEKQMQDAIEKSRKAAAASEKKTKSLEVELESVKKQLEGNQQAVAGFDETIKALQEANSEKKAPELEAETNKRFDVIVDVMKMMSDKLENLTARLEEPTYKGISSGATGHDRNLSGDPMADLITKSLDFFSNPNRVMKAMEDGFDPMAHARDMMRIQ